MTVDALTRSFESIDPMISLDWPHLTMSMIAELMSPIMSCTDVEL